MALPHYQSHSIVNLMSAVVRGCGGVEHEAYPPCPAVDEDALGQASNVLLLMLDGLGTEYLSRFPDSHLHRHMKAQLTSVCPSTTAAAVTTFTTGLAPQQHGITGWFMFLRELGMVTTVLPFQTRAGQMPLASSIPEALELVRQTSVFSRIEAEGWYLVPDFIVNSPYSRATTGGAERRGFKGMAGYFETIRRLIARPAKRERYIYAYWPGFDSLCHDVGNDSEQLAAHFRELDAGFAGLCSALAGTDTLVLATADHGLVNVAPGREVWLDRHPELARTLRLPLCGEPRLAYCYVRPGAQDEFLGYVHDNLAAYCTAHSAAEAVKAGWFGRGAPHPELMNRIGDYVLVMREGAIIKDRLRGEGPFRQVGTHGGLSETEMCVPLIEYPC